jgi:hypothetical protein
MEGLLIVGEVMLALVIVVAATMLVLRDLLTRYPCPSILFPGDDEDDEDDGWTLDTLFPRARTLSISNLKNSGNGR